MTHYQICHIKLKLTHVYRNGIGGITLNHYQVYDKESIMFSRDLIGQVYL